MFECAIDGTYSPTMQYTMELEELLTTGKHENQQWIVVKHLHDKDYY